MQTLDNLLLNRRIIKCSTIKRDLRHSAIWLFNLANITEEECLAYRYYLDEKEKKRVKHFSSPIDQKKFIICRALIKVILSKYCNISPAAIKLSYNAYQKPYLAARPQLQFNLSHTKEWGIFSIYKRGVIGVDIEAIAVVNDLENIMNLFASTFEQEWVLVASILKRFFMLWSAKEALIKAYGVGFAATNIPDFKNIVCYSENVACFKAPNFKVWSCLWNNHSIALCKLRHSF